MTTATPMRKTVDAVHDFLDPAEQLSETLRPPIQGRYQYRVRIYEGGGPGRAPAIPVVVVTDATPGHEVKDMAWLSNDAPRLAPAVLRAHLPAATAFHWITPSIFVQGLPQPSGDVFEQTRFTVFGAHQVGYDQQPRPSQSPALETQAAIRSRSDVEALIGERLDA